MKPIRIAALALLLSAAPARAGLFDGRVLLSIPVGAETFSIEQAIKGSDSTAERCALVPDGFWIEADGLKECLRVFKAGMPGADDVQADNDTIRTAPPAEAVFNFHGDVIQGGRWQGLRSELIAPDIYTRESPATLESAAAAFSALYKLPFVWVSRLGVYGSSGEYFETNRKRALSLYGKLLDQIKARFKLTRIHLVGQSAGGSMVAGLMAQRSDVGCAVMSSPNADMRRHAGFASYGGWQDYFNPANIVDSVPKASGLRIFVLSDRNDRQVSFATQQSYVDALRRAGQAPVHVIAKASDPSSHSLGQWAAAAMLMCLRGDSGDVIKLSIERASGSAETPPEALPALAR